MAETKSNKAKSKPKGSSKSSKTKSRASKASSKTKSGAAKAGSATKAAASSNGNGGHAVKETAQKVALPLLATGAAAAGAAAVIIGKNGHKQKKVLGVKVPKKAHLPHVGMPKVSMPKGKGLKGDVRRAAGAVTDAAEKADLIGKRISKVANSVQAVGEATDDAAKKS